MTADVPHLPISILDAIRSGTLRLEKAAIDQPRLNSELLLAQTLNLKRLDLYLNHDRPLDEAEVETFFRYLHRRSQGEPVQYILGAMEFYGLPIRVNPNVLIPRPETEILVDHVLHFLKKRDRTGLAVLPLQLDLFFSDSSDVRPLVVADIGVGSGAITLAIVHEQPAAIVYATDCSPEALETARMNADALHLNEKIRFLEGQWLGPLRMAGLAKTCDLIVSNPPYIPSSALPGLATEIRDYEPHLALDGAADGLDSYRAIVAQSPEFLCSGGMLALEIGSDQAEAIRSLIAETPGFRDIRVTQDYSRRDRVVSAIYSP